MTPPEETPRSPRASLAILLRHENAADSGHDCVMPVQSIADLDIRRLTNRRYFPSPAAWEDEVLYFLMLDRF